MIEPCVKVLWVKVRVYVCVCAEDRVEQRRHVHNEDGEVPGSHMSGPDTEDANRSANIRSWEPSIGPKHTRARHPASPGNQVTDKIASICWVEERQQKHVQPATGDIKLTKLLCNLATFSHGMSGLSNQI